MFPPMEAERRLRDIERRPRKMDEHREQRQQLEDRIAELVSRVRRIESDEKRARKPDVVFGNQLLDYAKKIADRKSGS